MLTIDVIIVSVMHKLRVRLQKFQKPKAMLKLNLQTSTINSSANRYIQSQLSTSMKLCFKLEHFKGSIGDNSKLPQGKIKEKEMVNKGNSWHRDKSYCHEVLPSM